MPVHRYPCLDVVIPVPVRWNLQYQAIQSDTVVLAHGPLHLHTTVTHTYDAWGQLTKTVVAGTGVSAVTTTMTYDKRGRRTGMTDPDRGAMTYEYNGFDELVKQTDARATTRS